MGLDSSQIDQFLVAKKTLYQEEYTSLEPLAVRPNALVYSAKDRMGESFIITEFAPLDRFFRDGSDIQPLDGFETEFEDGLEQFREYSKQLSRLSHPNIDGIVQRFDENNTAYAVCAAGKLSSVADQIDNDTFFFQPEEIEAIAEPLIKVGEYLTSFGIHGFDLVPKAIVVDDETSEPKFLLRHYLDGTCQKNESATGSEQGVVQSLARTLYSMVALRAPADPYRPLLGSFEDYNDRFLAPIDDCLDPASVRSFSNLEGWKNALARSNQRGAPASTRVAPASKPSARVQEFSKPKKSKVLPITIVGLALLGGAGYFAYDQGLFTKGGQSPELVETVEQPLEPANETTVAVVAAEPEPTNSTPEATETTSVVVENENTSISQPVEKVDTQTVASTAQAAAAEEQPNVADIFRALKDQNSPESTEEGVASDETTEAVEEPAVQEAPKPAPSEPEKTSAWQLSLPFAYSLQTGSDGVVRMAVDPQTVSDQFLAENNWYRRGILISKVAGQTLSETTDVERLFQDHFASQNVEKPSVPIEFYDPIFDVSNETDLAVNASLVETLGAVKLHQFRNGDNWALEVLATTDPSIALSIGDRILGEQSRQVSVETIENLGLLMTDLAESGTSNALLLIKKPNGNTETLSIGTRTFR